jgi:hypothetical protein
MRCDIQSTVRWRLAIVPLVLVSIQSSGCGLFNEYRPMHVMVRDAETKEPIAGVEITGMATRMLDVFGPIPPHGTTDASGQATLSAGLDRGLDLIFEADGYLRKNINSSITAEDVQSLPKAEDPSRIDLLINLERDPKATFVLIVPNHYRGLLRIRFEPTEGIEVAQKATYLVPVGPDGRAVVRLPKAICRKEGERNVAAREVSGKHVKWEHHCSEPEKIGLRWVHSTEDTELYIIGSGKEVEALDERFDPENANGKRVFNPVEYSKIFER